MTTYICPGCDHEEEAEMPPLCPKCLAGWAKAKSRMVEKKDDETV